MANTLYVGWSNQSPRYASFSSNYSPQRNGRKPKLYYKKARSKYLDGSTTAQQWSNDVTLSGISIDGTAAVIKYNKGGFAVKSGRYDTQIDYDATSGKSERLLLDFANGASQATIKLGEDGE